jgi:hypothetical protein
MKIIDRVVAFAGLGSGASTDGRRGGEYDHRDSDEQMRNIQRGLVALALPFKGRVGWGWC